MQEIDFRTKGRWAPSTQTAYENAWKDFLRFCSSIDALALPAEPETVAAFLKAREHSHSTAAISQRLAAVRAVHKDAKGQLPRNDPTRDLFTLDDPVISDAWKEIVRRKGNRHTPRAAIRSTELKTILRVIPDTFKGLQDRAVLLIGLACALRRSEIVALNRDDLEFDDETMLVHIRRSKTDQDGNGVVLAAARTGTDTCPVAAMEKWLEAAEITEGPIFLNLRTRTRAHPQMPYYLVKKHGTAAGFKPGPLGAHSLRRGFVTEVIQAGVTLKESMAAARHKTASIHLGYVQAETAAKNPAIRKLAL